ncbi:MAG: hypothetical protein DU429_05735 [Candidatus Tokpelaia sp.]|nr:MAG: hypothetical protein DU430_07515 [Candidatus Tokpelaia sp.]KAA6206723.1 MAG: hypothetical protein DU429_05735 [Candidatus Tokpelaia sp.]KAA6405294.1 hypothetical protein DPQ22_05420 [Candidatus Tokpelaia sp.]
MTAGLCLLRVLRPLITGKAGSINFFKIGDFGLFCLIRLIIGAGERFIALFARPDSRNNTQIRLSLVTSRL